MVPTIGGSSKTIGFPKMTAKIPILKNDFGIHMCQPLWECIIDSKFLHAKKLLSKKVMEASREHG